MEYEEKLYDKIINLQKACQNISKFRYLFLMSLIQSIILITMLPLINKGRKAISIVFILLISIVLILSTIYFIRNRKNIKAIHLLERKTTFKIKEIFDVLKGFSNAISCKYGRRGFNCKSSCNVKINNKEDINHIINLLIGHRK